MCETKKCKSCLEEKELCEFSKNSNKKDGLNYRCKICVKNNVSVVQKDKHPLLKICSKCKEEKSVEEFSKLRGAFDGLQYNCKVCKRSYGGYPMSKKTWYEANKDITIERSRLFYQENREDILEKRKKDPKRKEWYRKWYNEKRSDDFFNSKESIRGLIKSSFKTQSFKKHKRAEVILGCTFEEFKIHIEKQFLNWMNWENHGNICEELTYNCSWDLDHIIPISYAQTEEELYLLNHWSNFQPLCSKENRLDKKGKVYPCSNLELNITINE